MTDFYDWLTAADTGLTADRLAESFRLSQQELRRATEALAPAFTEGLRRAMTDPGAMSALAASFAPFTDPRRFGLGEPATGMAAQALAGQLLGAPDHLASLARHASLTSGIAPDTLQKLISSLSVLTMETMTRMMVANLLRHQPALPGTADYGSALAESMRRGANAVEALTRPSDEYGARARPAPGGIDLNAMFRDALTGRLPWLPPMAEVARRPAPSPGPAAGAPPQAPGLAPGIDPFLPFAAMMAAFAQGMGAAAAATPAAPAPAPAAAPPPPPVPRLPAPPAPSAGEAAGDAQLGGLWESGRRMQEDYVREMTALFRRYHPAADREENGGASQS